MINAVLIAAHHVFVGDYISLANSYIDPAPVFGCIEAEKFVGQEWLDRALDDVLAQNPSGYFVIEANAGWGKLPTPPNSSVPAITPIILRNRHRVSMAWAAPCGASACTTLKDVDTTVKGSLYDGANDTGNVTLSILRTPQSTNGRF